MHHLLHKTWFLGNWLHFSACHSWKWGPQVQRILRSSMFTYFHYWGTPNSNGENHPCSLFLMTISLLWFSGYLWIKKILRLNMVIHFPIIKNHGLEQTKSSHVWKNPKIGTPTVTGWWCWTRPKEGREGFGLGGSTNKIKIWYKYV